MILEQHYLGCLAQASYLIGDEASGEALVVDPRRDVDLYLERAAELGLTIRHVVLTHFHADFVSGHLELRERTGATIHLGARGRADYEFEPLADGDEICLGAVRVVALETPGHTPESICLTVHDGGDRPHAVLTGDTLFIGDVGRPDLMASVGVTARELGEMLYDSLHGKLLVLPDETLVYPGHGAGSMCGKNLSSETVSTVGDQRRTNYALQPMTREEFVDLVAAGQPEVPAYFAYDADLNRRRRATLEESLQSGPRALPLDEVLRLRDAGAELLDTRDPDEFARRHVAGSVNVGLGGKYATWVGTVLDRERGIVLITEPGRERESALRLGRIGYDKVLGHLEGGVESAAARPDLLQATRRVEPDELRRELEAADGPLVLDVRGPGERETSHIEGSQHVPLPQLLRRLDELPRDRRIAVQCASGYRSAIGASLLRRAGFERVEDLAGGIQAWEATTETV